MAERKSIYHGLTSDGHGPDEHGLGGLPSPEDPRDFAVADHPGYAAALATTFPTAWLEPNTPPRLQPGRDADVRRVQQRQRPGPLGPT